MLKKNRNKRLNITDPPFDPPEPLLEPLFDPEFPAPAPDPRLVPGRPLVGTGLVESMLRVVSTTVLLAGVVAGVERAATVDEAWDVVGMGRVTSLVVDA